MGLERQKTLNAIPKSLNYIVKVFEDAFAEEWDPNIDSSMTFCKIQTNFFTFPHVEKGVETESIA